MKIYLYFPNQNQITKIDLIKGTRVVTSSKFSEKTIVLRLMVPWAFDSQSVDSLLFCFLKIFKEFFPDKKLVDEKKKQMNKYDSRF